MLLELIKINKGFGIPGTHAFRPVLKDLFWHLEAGERIGIEGPSGSGKTTLMNIIGTLDHPDSGQVIFKTRDISAFSVAELTHFRNIELGFIFQRHHLLPQCTLMENVLLPVLPYKKRITENDKIWAEYLLQKTGIWEMRDQKPGEMSGGECQRTAVVRALINKPGLILADEPTGALDEANADNLGDMLINLCRDEGITLITVTHSKELAGKMDRIYQLHDGKLNS